jgi:hypothetical protein
MITGLSELEKWIKKRENYKIGNKSSLLSLLSSYGCSHLIWLDVVKRHISIEAFTKDLSEDYLSSNFQNQDEDILKWIKSDVLSVSLQKGDLAFSCVFYEDNNFDNYSIVLGKVESKTPISTIRELAQIGSEYLKQSTRIDALENSLKLAHSELEKSDIDLVSEYIAPDKLTENFINAVVPAIWYAVAHELVGPTFIEADPHDVNSPFNLGKVVGVFGSLDADLIGQLGHVFTLSPTSEPYLGESTNLVFSIPNDNARGGIELHSLTIVIGQDFINLSKSLYLDIKTALFTGIETIRQKSGEGTPWELALVDLDSSLAEVKSVVHPILKTIRINIDSYNVNKPQK